MVLKQVHDTNMRAKGHPERVFSVSHSPLLSPPSANTWPLPGLLPPLTPTFLGRTEISVGSLRVSCLPPISHSATAGETGVLGRAGKYRLSDCSLLLLTPGNPH